ncbi:UDP-glucosyltransferase 29-like [Lycium barbarum]|uniref:UDP-glucosyltransferase 29-like n=1 Tax=Lycium barbarum TaxID=112863 RepID=UPI00293E1495|nr:UDP-glucosyltransferase 29-like [Lycium barbarum]
MEREQKVPTILLFPWLAQGHVTPYLVLAKKLSKRNFHIYFLSTPIILESIEKTLAKQSSTLSIQLVEFNLPSLPELPPHYHTTNGLPPHLNFTLIKNFQMASSNFSTIIDNLNPNFLIYDSFQPWAGTIASLRNIPAIHLFTSGIATFSKFYHTLHENVRAMNCEMKEIAAQNLDEIDRQKILGGIALKAFEQSNDIVLVNSSKEIEGKYIDILSQLSKKEIIPIGPLIRDTIDEEDNSEIMQWLDKKDESSCVFISFGSEYILSNKDIEEIAKGLELSLVNFIWAIKFPTGVTTTIEEVLPQGLLEKSEKGIVVKGWLPQATILGHFSVGGFVTHCGWNSLLETISFGVPIIAMPKHLDQPTNARLIEELGLGVEILKDENGDIKREEVARGIRKVVENIGEIKKTVSELTDKIRINGEKEIDDLAKRLIAMIK